MTCNAAILASGQGRQAIVKVGCGETYAIGQLVVGVFPSSAVRGGPGRGHEEEPQADHCRHLYKGG